MSIDAIPIIQSYLILSRQPVLCVHVSVLVEDQLYERDQVLRDVLLCQAVPLHVGLPLATQGLAYKMQSVRCLKIRNST